MLNEATKRPESAGLPTDKNTTVTVTDRRFPTKKGNRKKSYLVAKANEELLRLQVELAAARLAVLKTALDIEENLEDDGAYAHSKTGATAHVGALDNRPSPRHALPATDEPLHLKQETAIIDAEQKNTLMHHGSAQQPSTSAHPDILELAEAITRAIITAQRPMDAELPIFNGSHYRWLPFRAAYFETEGLFSAVENTNRLRKSLKGKAKKAVEGLLVSCASPTAIMKSLELRFGRPEFVAWKTMERLCKLPRLTNSPRDVAIFASKISNAVAMLQALDCVNYMHNPEVSKAIVDKFTPLLRQMYNYFVKTQPKGDPELMKIERFLNIEAEL